MSIKTNLFNKINTNSFRTGVTKLGKPGALLPVALLETTVTGGRTYQAYKRGGYVEARERFADESISAVFWLFGIKMFNKIGDAIGHKLLKFPTGVFKPNDKSFDVGKDALRTPFKNLLKSVSKHAKEAGRNPVGEKLIAGFKFGKIISSVVLSTSLIGFVLPKVNMAVTSKIKDKMKAQKEKAKNASSISMDDFKNKVVSNKKGVGNNPAFTGIMPSADALATVAHNLENNNIYNLLTTDGGLFAGRAVNAWNQDDRVEKLFRDISSSYFYLFATPHVIKALQTFTPFGKIAKLDPSSALTVHNTLLSKVNETAGRKMGVADFKTAILGKPEGLTDKLKAIPFKDDVITLKALAKHLDERTLEIAKKMSKLQPEQAENGAVLTKQQVKDVLAGGAINEPDFQFGLYKKYFGDDLTNEFKFVSMKDIQLFRDNVGHYVKTVMEYAEKHNKGVVDESVLKAMNARNLVKYAGFFGAGFAVSAAFLSTIIPKTQYWITRKRTGKNEFPGMEDTKTQKAPSNKESKGAVVSENQQNSSVKKPQA